MAVITCLFSVDKRRKPVYDAIPLKLSNKGNQHYFHISISNAILLHGRRVPQNMRDAKIVTLFKNKVD